MLQQDMPQKTRQRANTTSNGNSLFSAKVKNFKDADIQALKEYLTRFPDTPVLLPISVGQPYHENGKFKASLHLLVRELGFKSIEFIVGDTLQRWSMAGKLGKNVEPDNCFEMSRELGDKWVDNVAKERLLRMKQQNEGVEFTITRWEDIAPCGENSKGEQQKIGLDEFDVYLKKYKELYDSSPEFKAKVDESAKIYQDRLKRRNQSKGKKESPDSSLSSSNDEAAEPERAEKERNDGFNVNYILEEIAGLHRYYDRCIVLKAPVPFYLAYPGGILPALDYARRNNFGISPGEKLPFEPLNLSIVPVKPAAIKTATQNHSLPVPASVSLSRSTSAEQLFTKNSPPSQAADLANFGVFNNGLDSKFVQPSLIQGDPELASLNQFMHLQLQFQIHTQTVYMQMFMQRNALKSQQQIGSGAQQTQLPVYNQDPISGKSLSVPPTKN